MDDKDQLCQVSHFIHILHNSPKNMPLAALLVSILIVIRFNEQNKSITVRSYARVFIVIKLDSKMWRLQPA